MPVDLTRLPVLEKLYLDNNKLSTLPPELGAMKNLKVLIVDNNMLVSVPGKHGTVICVCMSILTCLTYKFRSKPKTPCDVDS